MKITLRKPIKTGDKVRTEITLREPTIGEVIEAMKVFKTSTSDYAAHDEFKLSLISAVASVHSDTIAQMLGRDITKAFDFLQTFPLYGLPDEAGEPVEKEAEPVDEVMIPLDSPIVTKSGEVTEIVVQEGTWTQLHEAKKLLGKNPIGIDITRMHVHLLASVSGQPINVIERLPVGKFREAEKALANFQ